MKMNITKRVGKTNYHFQVEGKNLFELVQESQKLSFEDIAQCEICGKDNIILNSRIAQDYEYTEIKCKDCKSSLTFGRKKGQPDTFYLRRTEDGKLDWKKYEANNNVATMPTTDVL